MKTHPFRRCSILILALLVAAPAFGAPAATTGLSGSLESSRGTHFYKEPTRALMLAVFPGLLIHGYGHLYAKDKLTGTALLGGEILSLTAIGMGALMKSDPEQYSGGIFGTSNDVVERTGRRMMIYGGIGFAVTWFADILHAPTAAKDYNDRWNLSPVASIEDGTPTLAFAVRF
jgi:hypothetical protein